MKKGKVVKRVILIILCIILLTAVGAGVYGFIFIKNKLNKINYVEVDTNEIEINEEVKEQEELKGFRTIALLGIDSRSDDYGTGISICI